MLQRSGKLSRREGCEIIEYDLFRIKFIKPNQASLLHYDVTADQIFNSALDERSVTRVKSGYVWHIGNVERYTPNSGYFALGRTTVKRFEKFDQETNKFLVEQLETSPYTHCVFDAQYGFIGIARKPTLANTTTSIAGRLRELLSYTREVRENQIAVELDPIADPGAFLRDIRTAFRVASFTAAFHGPNPFDADALFQKPLSVYLSEANGAKGKTTIEGEDLNRETVESVARSTAATGNDASAKIKREPKSRFVNVKMRRSVVRRIYDDENHNPAGVLSDLRKSYTEVRGNDGVQTLEARGSDRGA